MLVELRIPEMGESIRDVEMGEWMKKEGEMVAKDEVIVVIETQKVTIDLPSPSAGKLARILKKTGDSAVVGEVIGTVDTEAVVEPKHQPAGTPAPSMEKAAQVVEEKFTGQAESRVMPAARRLLEENHIKPQELKASGPGDRLLKEDVVQHMETKEAARARKTPEPPPAVEERQEERVPMTPVRRRIAQRLVEAQNAAALLTTFNEIDMTSVKSFREQYQELFQEKYKIKLGFMSFFVKAAVEALKMIPQVNAIVDGRDIVYRNYYDIGVAVGSGKGLAVPVIRNADQLGFAEIEQIIADYGRRARENKLKLDELEGGTFTISNGGIYGSLLSTPIVNPPQSGILGMHSIQDRPIALNGNVVIRPMMYVALTYDHRIVDGREAVTFLKRIKEVIEAPQRMLLEV